MFHQFGCELFRVDRICPGLVEGRVTVMNRKSVFDTGSECFIVTDISEAHVGAVPFQCLVQALQTDSQYTHYYHFVHRSRFGEIRFRHHAVGFVFLASTYPVHLMGTFDTAAYFRCVGHTA